MSDRKTKAADGASAVLDKIAGWPDSYRAIGERIHEIVLDAVPELRPKL